MDATGALSTRDRPSEGLKVEVDPERVLLLDVNYTNNSATTEPRAAEASEMEPEMARVAAGSDAHLRIFRMTSAAWRSGFARVFRAPIVVGMFALTMAAALPAAIVLRNMIGAHLGRSLMADAAAEAVNYDWWQEFVASLRAGDDVFQPSSALRNARQLEQRARRQTEIAPIGRSSLRMLAWIFLSAASSIVMRGNGPFGLRIFWRVRLLLALPASGDRRWRGLLVSLFVCPSLAARGCLQAADTGSRSRAQRVFWRIALYAPFGASVIMTISYSITRGFG